MEKRRVFRLIKDVPMLHRGLYVFYESTGHVHRINNGKEGEYPLRNSLAGYLWLLLTEKGYFRHVETNE